MYKDKQTTMKKLNVSEQDLLMWRAIRYIKYSERTDKYDIDSVLEMRTMTLGLEDILNKDQYIEVIDLMDKQSSLSRKIFRDFQHDKALTANEYDKLAQANYSLKSYFGLSAFQFAKGQYESMNTWYLKTIENLQNKIISISTDIETMKLDKSKKLHTNFYRGKKHKLRLLENKLAKLQSKPYLSTWFGNKKLEDLDSYRKSRLSLVISGEECHKGNRYIRIYRDINNYKLKLFKHTLDIKIPKSHLGVFSVDDFNRQTMRISFNSKGKLVLNCTYVFLKPIKRELTEKSRGCVGIDIGPKEIAVCYTKNDGNPLEYQHFSTGNLLDKSSEDTKRNISLILDEIIKKAIHFKMFKISIENLKFRTDHSFKSKKLNRMLSKFPRTMFKSLLQGKCIRRGISLKEINPAYTSVIGLFKYSNRDNLETNHNSKSKDLSASLVIARRGLGLKEKAVICIRLFGKLIKIPIKSLVLLLEDSLNKFNMYDKKNNSNWSLWSFLKRNFKTPNELTAHLLATPKTLVVLSEILGSRCNSLSLALTKISAV